MMTSATKLSRSLGRLSAAGALVAVFAAGAAQAAGSREIPRALFKMTPAQIAEKVAVHDDRLEDHVRFSTQPVLKKGAFTDGVAVHDGFVEALKSRNAAETRWRIRHDLTTFGAHRDVNLVHLRSGEELLKITPSTVRRWGEECPESLVTCGQHMTVEFEVPEKTIREIAAAFKPGDKTPWPVRFKDTNGQDITVGLAPSEVAGLLTAVDSWKR